MYWNNEDVGKVSINHNSQLFSEKF